MKTDIDIPICRFVVNSLIRHVLLLSTRQTIKNNNDNSIQDFLRQLDYVLYYINIGKNRFLVRNYIIQRKAL